MLKIQNQEHFDKVIAFACEAGLRANLDKQLKILDEFGGDREKSRCLLQYDCAPYSFAFALQRKNQDGSYSDWFFGGLIFHGKHDNGGDGSYPTLAVSLSPSTGWQIHT